LPATFLIEPACAAADLRIRAWIDQPEERGYRAANRHCRSASEAAARL
jgi:hypothetical protein